MRYIGIDLSLKSPGLCALDNNFIRLFYWAQKKRYKLPSVITAAKSSALRPFDIEIRRFDSLPKDTYDRKLQITSDIMKLVLTRPPKEVKIGIEGYAFHVSNSSSLTKLAELNGMVKGALKKNGYSWIEIPPASLKKHYAGNGFAKKPDMGAVWCKDKPKLHLFTETKQPFGCPVNDMIDAYAICEYLKSPPKKK